MEDAIGERVHLKKFRILEKNVTDYHRKEDFKIYKDKMEILLADLLVRFKPLALSSSVDSKVEDIRANFESSLQTVSKKHDCARDREATLHMSRNVLEKCEAID